MSKTTPAYRETRFGIVSITEIEGMIFDGVIQTKAYILRNAHHIEWDMTIFIHIHELLCGNIFENGGQYRTHSVQVWDFTPIAHTLVPIEMHHLDADTRERLKHIKTEADKKELLAYVMWRLLWIHPFFDYNGRSVRLFGELFLIQHWLPLSTFVGSSRDAFTRAMQRATNEWVFDDIIELL